MKIVAFAQNQYRNFPDDFQDRHEGTVTTPYALAEPGEVRAAFRDYLDYIMQAARSGFDGVAFTEHAQTTYDMIANPSLIGSAIGYATETEGLDVAVYPVGRSLGKAREPVRVAEEYAMIDCISGGRLMAGFPVGLMFDAAINNGVPPIEVRQRYTENLRLILRAWHDHEPFAWNGRFTQLPSVNIWPRPLQQPLPVWITGVGNPATMRLVLENNFGFNYFGWFGSELTARRVFDRFWEIADERRCARQPQPDGLHGLGLRRRDRRRGRARLRPPSRILLQQGAGRDPARQARDTRRHLAPRHPLPAGGPGQRFRLRPRDAPCERGADIRGRRGRRRLARDGGRPADRHRPRLPRRQSGDDAQDGLDAARSRCRQRRALRGVRAAQAARIRGRRRLAASLVARAPRRQSGTRRREARRAGAEPRDVGDRTSRTRRGGVGRQARDTRQDGRIGPAAGLSPPGRGGCTSIPSSKR